MNGQSYKFLTKETVSYLLFIFCLHVYKQEVQIILKVLTNFGLYWLRFTILVLSNAQVLTIITLSQMPYSERKQDMEMLWHHFPHLLRSQIPDNCPASIATFPFNS